VSRAKPAFVPAPRIWTAYQVACRLGISEETWRRRREAWEAQGFPAYDDFLGGWDGEAIERWFDRRAGLVSTTSGDDFRGRLAEWQG
jgi:hypothetical protein